jgi:cytochrome c-type biogenesis protein CcmH/NrfG
MSRNPTLDTVMARLRPIGRRYVEAADAVAAERAAMRPLVVDLYRMGVTVQEIVAVSGLSRQGVYDAVRAAQVPAARGGRNQHTNTNRGSTP